jgi:hypothetical protein
MSEFYIEKTYGSVTTSFHVIYTDSDGKVAVSQTNQVGSRSLLRTLAQSEEVLGQVHLNQFKRDNPFEELRSYFQKRGWKVQDPV